MQFGHAHGFRPQVVAGAGRALAGRARDLAGGRRRAGGDRRAGPGPGERRDALPADRPSSARCGARRPARPGWTCGRARASGWSSAAGRVVGARVDGAGRRGRPGRGRDRAVRPAGPERDPARRRLRHRLRQPHLPAAPRRRARTDELADRLVRRVRRLPASSSSRTSAGTSRWSFVRPTADPALKELRHDAAFDAACRAIPALAEWTDPARSVPTSPATAGGALRNTYHPQRRAARPGGGRATRSRRPRRRPAAASRWPRCRSTSCCGCWATPGRRRRRSPNRSAPGRDRADPALGRRPRDDGRRGRAPLAGPRRRPDTAAALRPGRRGGRGRAAPAGRTSVPYVTMAALPATLTAGRAAGPRRLRGGWRPPHAEGPSRDRLVEIIEDAHSAAA